MDKEVRFDESAQTIIVTYMGRKVAADVTGFASFKNDPVAIITIRSAPHRNQYDCVVSLTNGCDIASEWLLKVDDKNLKLLQKIRKNYYTVRDVMDS